MVRKKPTDHTETTRANAMRMQAVRRPPTIVQRPHKANQQTRRTTHTASLPLTANGKRSDSVSNKTANRPRAGLNTLLASQAQDREAREDPNWSSTRATHPPHHLTERAEMRRERQPRTENTPENSPSPTPRRACRVEEGEPTGTER